MPPYRTLNHLEEDYFRRHPEEIEPYLHEIFEAFAEDGDSGALLASLRTIARVKGISPLADEVGMSRHLTNVFNCQQAATSRQYGLMLIYGHSKNGLYGSI